MTEYKTATELQILIYEYGREVLALKLERERKMKELEFEDGEEVYVRGVILDNDVDNDNRWTKIINSNGRVYYVPRKDLHKKPRFEFGEMILVSDYKSREGASLAKFAGYRPNTNEILAINHYLNGMDSSVINSWKYAWKLKEFDFVDVDGNKYYKDQVLCELY